MKKTHACGGETRSAEWNPEDGPVRYCIRCGAFAYEYLDIEIPNGTDKRANLRAFKAGEHQTPDGPVQLRIDPSDGWKEAPIVAGFNSRAVARECLAIAEQWKDGIYLQLPDDEPSGPYSSVLQATVAARAINAGAVRLNTDRTAFVHVDGSHASDVFRIHSGRPEPI